MARALRREIARDIARGGRASIRARSRVVAIAHATSAALIRRVGDGSDYQI
jgi:transposase-like protein